MPRSGEEHFEHRGSRAVGLGAFPPIPSEFVEPPFGAGMGVLLTMRCNLECRHCMLGAGPHRREEVVLETARGWLDQMAACGVEAVGFTGGEPFCAYRKLLTLAADCRRLGLRYALITNGFWATSARRAFDILSELAPNDLSASTDLFHVDRVPLQQLSFIEKACSKLRIAFDLTVAWDEARLDETRRLMAELKALLPDVPIRMTRVFPYGRGQDLRSPSMRAVRAAAPKLPCLFASTPYVLPQGDVCPCIGPIVLLPSEPNPLRLGSLANESLETILRRARENPILQGIRLWGPQFLEELVARHGPRHELPTGYRTESPCEACYELLRSHNVRAFLSEAAMDRALAASVSQSRLTQLAEG